MPDSPDQTDHLLPPDDRADPDDSDDSPAPREVLITPAEAGTRLDRYLADVLPDVTRSQVRTLLDGGAILLNGQPTKAGHALRPGDQITLLPPPMQPTDLLPEALPLEIVYEDAAIAVVNKAAGMVVHPAPGHPRGTLVNALLARYPDMRIGGSVRPGIVHRLDQATSGLLVVARTDQAMQMLTTQQQARQMHKAYLAVVAGRFKQSEGVIEAPLGRHPTDRKRQAVLPTGGREARTFYRVLEELGDYTLLEARLDTGRTHQIRVHCAHIHHPVVGDPLYAPRKQPAFGLERQFLHAYQLGFVLPSTGTWRRFESALPDDLAAVLAKLRRMRG